MITDFSLIELFQVLVACIMCFSFGMSLGVSDKIRAIAEVVGMISSVILLISNL